MKAWKSAFAEKGKGEAHVFDERVECLEPIITHFSRLGKLDVLELPDGSSKLGRAELKSKFADTMEKTTMPQYIVVTGLAEDEAAKQAGLLATSFGGKPVTKKEIDDYAEQNLDKDAPKRTLVALKRLAQESSSAIMVLDKYPENAD